MFISSARYLSEVEKIVQSPGPLRIAVAFWGQGSAEMFLKDPDRPMRIICNLAMGGTNPAPITELLRSAKASEGHVEIRQLDNLHAKVILGEESAVVGSANFSANGLNYEDEELKGWHEAGALIQGQPDLQAAGAWFEALWQQSRPITAEDMEQATQAWRSRRSSRMETEPKKPLSEKDAAFFKDRPVHALLFVYYASEQALSTFEEVKQEVQSSGGQDSNVSRMDFFEREAELPKDATLVSVHVGARGKLLNMDEAVYRPLPDFDKIFVTAEGESQWVRVVIKDEQVLGHAFDERMRARLSKVIDENRPAVRQLCETHDWLVPVHELLLLEQRQDALVS